MPEGHTLHRLARDQQRLFAGTVVRASSPQGRFADGAAQLDGGTLLRAEAYGKHLLHHYAGRGGSRHILHVHLGLYGKFSLGRLASSTLPEPRGALRLRLVNETAWADLRGATTCELATPDQLDSLLARLGPDPLRRRSDPAAAYRRIGRSRTPIATLLMDQTVVAGIGNVYRAELLFRHRIDPLLPGRELSERRWLEMWTDLVGLMRAGVRSGRIVTVLDEHRRPGRRLLTREESVYVYRRTGLPCRVCCTPIRAAVHAARNLFWCPECQAPGRSG